MKKLRIGIVCYPSIGGSGIIATELGKKLATNGHEIHFISYEPPFRLNRDQKNILFHKVPINEYSLFKFPDYTLPLSVTISDVHHKFGLDIVHVHYAVPHATAALLAKDICKNCLHTAPKVITTLHGTDISLLANDPSLKPIIRYSIEKSDAVTAVSSWLAKETTKTLKTRKEIEVIHNFYDPIPVKKDKQKLRWDLGLPANDFLLIHLSNLRSVKRIPDLLKIVSLLRKDRKIKLVIASGGDFKQYNSLANKLEVSKQIKIFPKVKDVESLISACNLGLFTSKTESFGLSILECMSYGLPVISTNVGGIPEVIENGKSGWLFEVGEVKKIAEMVIRIKVDSAKYSQASKNAILRSREFTSEKIVPRYEELYKKIVK